MANEIKEFKESVNISKVEDHIIFHCKNGDFKFRFNAGCDYLLMFAETFSLWQKLRAGVKSDGLTFIFENGYYEINIDGE